jgi:hypothetical protein
MSAEAPAFTRSWPVGDFTATLTCPRLDAGAVACAVIEWSPSQPGGRLTPSELEQYCAGRAAAFAELAQRLGLRIGVVDV